MKINILRNSICLNSTNFKRILILIFLFNFVTLEDITEKNNTTDKNEISNITSNELKSSNTTIFTNIDIVPVNFYY